MSIAGTKIRISNPRLPFFLIVFFGIMAFGSVLYWRQQLMRSSSYAGMPLLVRTSTEDPDALRSKNYQIEVTDTSPSVK